MKYYFHQNLLLKSLLCREYRRLFQGQIYYVTKDTTSKGAFAIKKHPCILWMIEKTAQPIKTQRRNDHLNNLNVP